MGSNVPPNLNDFSSMHWSIGMQQLFSEHHRPVRDDRDLRQDVYGTHTRDELRGRPAVSTEQRGQKRTHDKVKKEDALATEISRDTTSTLREPTLIDASLLLQRDDQPCRCDIGYHCTHASHAPLDHRMLLSENDRKRERADAEAFERQRGAAPLLTKIVSEARIREICEAIDEFCDSKTVASRCEGVRSILSWITKMEFATIPHGTPQDVARTEILPRLHRFLLEENDIRRQKQLPLYIEEELTVLMRKWERGDWDGNSRRGLLEKRNAVDPDYALKRSGHYFGTNQLVNGQMFETFAELRRDGVHPTAQAGISGNQEGGAYSVVMSCIGKQHYADVNKGYMVEYMGTLAKDTVTPGGSTKPTDHTKILQRSLSTGQPIRLIRKIKLAHIAGPQRKEAYRYDGLYQVTHAKLVDPAHQGWSFSMERLPYQGPLRPLPVPNRMAFLG